MRDLCRLIGWTLVDLLRSRAALEAEIWTLRQQINVLRQACLCRKPHPRRPASLDYAGLLWLALERVSFQYLSLRHLPVANGSLLRIWGEKTR